MFHSSIDNCVELVVVKNNFCKNCCHFIQVFQPCPFWEPCLGEVLLDEKKNHILKYEIREYVFKVLFCCFVFFLTFILTCHILRSYLYISFDYAVQKLPL